MISEPILRLVDMRVGMRAASAGSALLHGIDLSVHAGECVAIVGDSGAGKSLLARAALGLLPLGLAANSEQHELNGNDMRHASEAQWRSVLGREAGYVHQDALGALDPLMRVGAQTGAPLRRHRMGNASERAASVLRALARAGLPDPGSTALAWPHELSGGMRQRALVAEALIAGPGLLVADEPTTALDATVQRRVLEMLRSEVDSGTALIFVSHDLAAVARIADRVLVLSGGEVVESAPTAELLKRPRHATTIALWAAARPITFSHTVKSAPRTRTAIEVRDLAVRHPGEAKDAITAVNFTLAAGRTLGIVGESGAGKSSLAAALLATRLPHRGEVLLAGEAWSALSEKERRPLRRRIQLVPQSASASFSPGVRVGGVLKEALRAGERARGGSPRDRTIRDQQIAELLHQVGLDDVPTTRRVETLSGGQSQRLAIARALATRPEVLVCDEAVSALDATVQVTVLELLSTLQRATGVAIVFISHDLEAVRRISDDVLVLRSGITIEQGPAAQVFTQAKHPFTRALLSASSIDIHPAASLQSPSAVD